MNTGILLLNLGTPDGPNASQVRPYLKQFLMDPFVIDIPAPARWALVNLLILPKRPHASAEAYQKIWTERGSPLLYHTLDLGQKVQMELGSGYVVKVGMRYGNPSVASAIEDLTARQVDRIILFPLYPQYSLAATESSIVEFERIKAEQAVRIPHTVIRDFYDHPAFVSAFSEIASRSLEAAGADHVLFSFHGIPERHVLKTDPGGAHCLKSEHCCAKVTEVNRLCYRAQSFATARAIAEALGLEREKYSVSFQSRLGRTPWIKPYTDLVYGELIKKGVKRLAVVCPSFVADCLETLEEIEMRGREQFREEGGEDLVLVPSLNSERVWAEAVSQMIREH